MYEKWSVRADSTTSLVTMSLWVWVWGRGAFTEGGLPENVPWSHLEAED